MDGYDEASTRDGDAAESAERTVRFGRETPAKTTLIRGLDN
ncbi:hypothetical protein [Halorubrum lacusprofundi]|jgi:replication factor A1|nr:hypothetical protein [Halorubrum lacusprofundi]